MLGDRLGGDRFRILIVGMLRDGMRLIRRCRLILRGGIVQRHIGRSLMRRGARLLRPLLVHEPESAERLGKHRTQLGHALRDGRLTRLQLGDAPLKILQLDLRGLAAILDLRRRILAGLFQDLRGLIVGLLALARRIRVGILAHGLRLADQLVGFLLGGHATLFEVFEQLAHLLGRFVLLGGDVSANLLDLGVDLAHRLRVADLGVVANLLRLRLGRIDNLARPALRVGHHLGHLLAHVGQFLVRLRERRLNLVVGLGLELGNLLVRAPALRGDLLGRLRLHLGDLTLLLGALRRHALFMLLARIGEFEINGLTLLGHDLRRFGAQLGGVLLRAGRNGLRLIGGVAGNRIGLGLSVIEKMLRIQLRVVDQRLRLSLGGRASRGGILLGTLQQLGAGLLRGGKHLLGVGAQRGERVVLGRLTVALLLQLRLQLQQTIPILLDLRTQRGQRLLRAGKRPVHLLLIVSTYHNRELVRHVRFLSPLHLLVSTTTHDCTAWRQAHARNATNHTRTYTHASKKPAASQQNVRR